MTETTHEETKPHTVAELEAELACLNRDGRGDTQYADAIRDEIDSRKEMGS